VLGGAFNPPHLGHLVLAEEALWRLDLEGVVLVPTGVAPHKRIEDDPGAEVRLEMARLAAEGNERLSVSALEVEREGPSYSFETLEQLAARRDDIQLCLLMGADAALGFGDWQRPERVLELATLGVAGRPGVDDAGLQAALERAGAGERATVFAMPGLEISSSAVRERVAAGRPVRYLTPPGVADLIAAKGLYA
jgi:nicotinate-nucleotide adenylyltransferase